MQGLSISSERLARRACIKVRFERTRIDAEILAIEAGRDRSSGRVTRHALVVDQRALMVPGYRPGAMDRLTRALVHARDGDRLALGEAIRLSQAEVWRLAAHLVGPSEADDVTQDVCVRAWRALPSFRAESSGRTWLLSLARRACADAVRRQTRWRRLKDRLRSQPSGSSPAASGLDELHGLDDLISCLQPAQREAFTLTQVIGCSYAETAELCRVRIGTIRSRVARARLELIELMRQARAV
jgi:RNA polymerase sigma-70 factor, ECF subfamily